MYRGKYETVIDIRIKSELHEQCLKITQLAKKLCESWRYAGIKFEVHKSARKGEVLRRDLLVCQTGYAHNIIIFRESLKCALYDFIFRGIVEISDRGVTPTENNIK